MQIVGQKQKKIKCVGGGNRKKCFNLQFTRAKSIFAAELFNNNYPATLSKSI